MKTFSSTELINVMKEATAVYGDRPVYVTINNHKYLINDLEFSAKGNNYNLILSDIKADH